MIFRTFDHTADIGIEAEASTREELFAEMARALFSLIVERFDAVETREEVAVDLPPDDDEYLLFDWLNELLYQFDTARLVFTQFEVRFDDEGLHARAWGEPFDPARHGVGHEVKAITYHQLRVAKEGNLWKGRVIVDI